jgi:hypothetical protein
LPPGDAIAPASAGRVDPRGDVIVIGRARRRRERGHLQLHLQQHVSARDGMDGQWWVLGSTLHLGVDRRALTTGLKWTRSASKRLVRWSSRHPDRPPRQCRDDAAAWRHHFPGTPGEPPALKPGDVVEIEVTGAGVCAIGQRLIMARRRNGQ